MGAVLCLTCSAALSISVFVCVCVQLQLLSVSLILIFYFLIKHSDIKMPWNDNAYCKWPEHSHSACLSLIQNSWLIEYQNCHLVINYLSLSLSLRQLCVCLYWSPLLSVSISGPGGRHSVCLKCVRVCLRFISYSSNAAQSSTAASYGKCHYYYEVCAMCFR